MFRVWTVADTSFTDTLPSASTAIFGGSFGRLALFIPKPDYSPLSPVFSIP
jgi:hypothetical protein